MKRIESLTSLSLLGLGLLIGANTTANAQTTATTANGYDGQANPVPAGITPTKGAIDSFSGYIRPTGAVTSPNFLDVVGGTMPVISGTTAPTDIRAYGILRFDLTKQLKTQLTAAFGTGLYSFTSIKAVITQSNFGSTHNGMVNAYYTTDDTTPLNTTTGPFVYPADGVLYTGTPFNPFYSATTPTTIPAGKEYLNNYLFFQDTTFNPSVGNGYNDKIELLTGTKGSADLALKVASGTTATIVIDPDNVNSPTVVASWEGQNGFFSTSKSSNSLRYLYYAPYLQVTAIAGGAFGGQITLDSLTGILPDGQTATAVLEFHPVGGGTVITKNVTLSPDLSFYVPGIPAGTYDIGLKLDRGLRSILRGVSTGNGAVTLNFPTILTGDVDGNNIVNVDDLSSLLLTFNNTKGDGTYETNATADLNFDNFINVDDLSLLLFNFNVNGQEF